VLRSSFRFFDQNFVYSLMHATCPAHFIFLDLIILIITIFKWRHFCSFCSFCHIWILSVFFTYVYTISYITNQCLLNFTLNFHICVCVTCSALFF
jgi:hypothetical protein